MPAARDHAGPSPTLATRAFEGREQPGVQRSYLLVCEYGSSAIFPLAAGGEVTIGRAAETELRLRDQSASRQHARLRIEAGQVILTDLGSRNGTRVNGETLSAPRPLDSGDVITICDTALIFYRGAPQPHVLPLLGPAELRRRLDEEVARARHYGRPLALLCVGLGEGTADRPVATQALTGRLRPIDLCGFSEDRLLLLLPELDPDEAEEAAGQVQAALAACLPHVRLGLALCPLDGGDTEALLGVARAAAAAAPPAGLTRAADIPATRQVGDRVLIVAEPAMARVYELIERLARSELPVLVLGETGAGKEVAAAALHHWSPRAGQRLLSLNCAALPESLVENELFGHERGAFSGAAAAQAGLLESARGGTVFLDEVGELPLPVQAKLLRVLETRRLIRLGDTRERDVDIRIVAATNRDLEAEVKAGRFRQDLLFRLEAATVVLPPLRERRRELPILARAFLQQACQRAGRPPMALSVEAMQVLLDHPWPGNVRELRNAMDYAVAIMDGPLLMPWHLPERVGGPRRPPETPETERTPGPAQFVAPTQQPGPPPEAPPQRFRPLGQEVQELERCRIAEALAATGGVQTKAAELIGVPLRTFITKMNLYQLGPRKPGGGT